MPILTNKKREAYCLERVRGRTQTDAYIVAGFQVKSPQVAEAAACRLEKDPEVLNRIEELRAKVLPKLNKMAELKAEQVVLSRAWVIEKLIQNARIALGEVPVRLTLRSTLSQPNNGADQPETVTVEVSDRDAAAANKALELLGKTPELRMWVEQVEHGRAGDFSKMSDEELDAFLVEATAQLTAGTFDDNGTQH